MAKERLISANELYRLIEEEFDGVCVYDVESFEAVNDFQSIVDRATTVDAEPVRHGTWIGLEYDGYADGNPVYDRWECSKCGCEWSGEEDTLPNYCPDCGTKMDGEE